MYFPNGTKLYIPTKLIDQHHAIYTIYLIHSTNHPLNNLDSTYNITYTYLPNNEYILILNQSLIAESYQFVEGSLTDRPPPTMSNPTIDKEGTYIITNSSSVTISHPYLLIKHITGNYSIYKGTLNIPNIMINMIYQPTIYTTPSQDIIIQVQTDYTILYTTLLILAILILLSMKYHSLYIGNMIAVYFIYTILPYSLVYPILFLDIIVPAIAIILKKKLF
jgi:hypothetical protein